MGHTGTKSYRESRSYENLQHCIYTGVGPYDIPQLDPCTVAADNWISFNFARTCEEPEQHGVHFYIDDYQFQRLWSQPDTYLPMLSRFQAVCSPDFSLYTDFPRVMQLYNHYRKHWLARYWQQHGINVLPTISWAEPDSWDWCFDGEPVGGYVSVSSVGTQNTQRARDLFLAGYREMLARLQPDIVIFYGEVPDACEGNIVQVRSFLQKRWRDR